jgi:nucleoside-diphosphate-sugar epimerase
MEKTYSALGIETRPLITRMVAEVFGTHQGFTIDKAYQELGYEPRIGFDEGMHCVERWLRQRGSC